MRKPLLIGVTGGIGSGKSTVCKIFETLGIPVYYADDRGKVLMVEDPKLVKRIMTEFGQESYTSTGQLNRAYLAQIVFPNPERLEKLNSFVHPSVATDFEKWVLTNQDKDYLLKEAALLYEIGSYKALDATICVMASKDVRIQRVLLRDEQRTKEQVEQIIESQTNDATRRKLSDYRVENDTLLLPAPLPGPGGSHCPRGGLLAFRVGLPEGPQGAGHLHSRP